MATWIAAEASEVKYLCYSPACRAARRAAVHDGGWSEHPHYKCFSPSCRKQPYPEAQKILHYPDGNGGLRIELSSKKSYWKHPAIRKMRIRIRICLALDVLRSMVTPFASFVPRAILNYFSRVALAAGRLQKRTPHIISSFFPPPLFLLFFSL